MAERIGQAGTCQYQKYRKPEQDWKHHSLLSDFSQYATIRAALLDQLFNGGELRGQSKLLSGAPASTRNTDGTYQVPT